MDNLIWWLFTHAWLAALLWLAITVLTIWLIIKEVKEWLNERSQN